MLDVVDLGTPRMDLHDLHLNEPEQPGLIIDPHPCALITVTLLDPKLMDRFRNGGQRSHVIESCAVDASDQFQRSTSEVFESRVSDQLPITSQLVAGRNDCIG